MYGTAPSVRANVEHVRGKTVLSIRTFGKHLVVDMDSGQSIRIHLGMSGRWVVLPADRRAPGSARLALTTQDHHACCFGAPKLEVGRTPAIEKLVSRLGPDILGVGFEPRELIERARTRNAGAIAEVLLDQKVIAGIGNVYKSELLFLVGIHPESPVSSLSDRELLEIASRAKTLLASNVRLGGRSTTGERGRGRETWVYDRAGLACRRCATAVVRTRLGDRVTYWCPSCQAPR